MNPRLLGIAGPFHGNVLKLASGEISIGREPSNHLWTVDPALSRRHCLVIRDGEQVTIRDLESRNGTVVNGMPIKEHSLRHGDQISIGDSVLVFLVEEDEDHHLQRSTVELADTADAGGSQFLLRQEDALYLQPDKLAAQLPQTDRLTRDLNDILSVLDAPRAIPQVPVKARERPALPGAAEVLAALGTVPTPVDELVRRCQVSAASVAERGANRLCPPVFGPRR